MVECKHLKKWRTIFKITVVYILCIIILAIVVAAAALSIQNIPKKSYQGVSAIGVGHMKPKDFDYIAKIRNSFKDLDFFHKYLDYTTLHFPNSLLPEIEKLLVQGNLTYRVLVQDLQSLIEIQEQGIEKKKEVSKERYFDLETFHPYEEISAYLHQLSKINELVQVETLGYTHEGREINLVKIAKKDSKSKPIIYLDCLLNSDDWASSAVCLWILHEISSSKDSNHKKLREKYDWYIKPVSNPDGYMYTWKRDRLWRKNKYRNDDSICSGVHLDLNFNVGIKGFGRGAISADPCSPLYAGPSPFSEPETRAIREVLDQYKNRIKLALFMHSTGQMWMSASTAAHNMSSQYKENERVMRIATDAIKAHRGTKYHYGKTSEKLIWSTAADYAFTTNGILHSYVVELPYDESNYGQLIPVENIKQAAAETWNGIMAAALAV